MQICKNCGHPKEHHKNRKCRWLMLKISEESIDIVECGCDEFN